MKKTLKEAIAEAAYAGFYVEKAIKNLEKELSIPEGFLKNCLTKMIGHLS